MASDVHRDDVQIAHLRELLGLQDRTFREHIEGLRKEWVLQERATKEALRLQSEELARRLEILNHESSRIQAAAARSVSAELYQADQRTLCARIGDLERRQLEYRDTASAQLGTLRESVIADVNQRMGSNIFMARAAAALAVAIPVLMRLFFP